MSEVAIAAGTHTKDADNYADATRRRVMIVDDDPVALAALNRLVTQWGYDVVLFTNFEDARAFLSVGTPHVLVVDVRLGMYNGLQLVHLARQLQPSMTVIAVSGFDDAVIRAEAASVGAMYMSKPLNLDELRRQLAEPDSQSAV